MQRTCPHCHQSFEISPEEESLHQKINASFETGPFPLPQLCHDCRLIRKMVWRNERFLYQRTCDASGKKILSVYPQNVPFPVYERSEWWSDKWDAQSFGQEFDFTRSFFDQYADLLKKVPRQALNLQNSENCDYCNFAFESRNSYLTQCEYRSESLLYCYWLLDCKDCIDCSYCFETQLCLGCTDCNHAYNCYQCVLSHTCTDCSFCYDCRGCTECFGCVGLRRKSFCLFNEQLSKEDYHARLAELDLQNLDQVRLIRERTESLRLQHPHLYSVQEKTENCTGDYIFESKDCSNCFQIYRSQDCINVQDAETKDALDCYHPGWSELTYECYSLVSQHSCAFSIQCWTGSDMFYSDNCQSCSHCFGCISLRNKQYCILNRQYTEEDYGAMITKVRAHMERSGEWGLFFPIQLSPFAYNQSMAQQDFPLTKEEVHAKGWVWAEDPGQTRGKETRQWADVPQHIRDVPDSITDEILACSFCSRNYKVIPQELKFYKEGKFPLPRTCPDCRHEERLKTRNPRKLFDRTCANCGKGIQTTYAPHRAEKVVCEECYLKEVY